MSTTASRATGRLTVDRKEFGEALHTTGFLADPKSRFAWRRDVVLRADGSRLQLCAESDEASVTVEIPAAGGVGTEVAVPQAVLRKSVEAFGHEELGLRRVSVSSFELTGPNRSVKLDMKSPKAAQAVGLGKRLCWFRSTGATLAEALEVVSRCASDDERKSTLNTVAIDVEDDHPVVVASDSYRLAVIDLDGKARCLAEPQLVHIAAVKALVRDLKRARPEQVEVEIGAEATSVSYSGTTWLLRRAPGSYLKWRALLSVEGSRLMLARKELEGALKAIRVLAANGREPVKLILGPACSILFTSEAVGHLKEDLPGAIWDGDPMVIGFSPARLADAIAVIDDDSLEARITSPLRPALFERDGRRYLLMPIKLSGIEPKQNGAVSSNR